MRDIHGEGDIQLFCRVVAVETSDRIGNGIHPFFVLQRQEMVTSTTTTMKASLPIATVSATTAMLSRLY